MKLISDCSSFSTELKQLRYRVSAKTNRLSDDVIHNDHWEAVPFTPLSHVDASHHMKVPQGHTREPAWPG
jgi:hypothetical protein